MKPTKLTAASQSGATTRAITRPGRRLPALACFVAACIPTSLAALLPLTLDASAGPVKAGYRLIRRFWIATGQPTHRHTLSHLPTRTGWALTPCRYVACAKSHVPFHPLRHADRNSGQCAAWMPEQAAIQVAPTTCETIKTIWRTPAGVTA
ncbi:hypothetical protein D9M73_237100 [compost metagenome]